MQTSIIILNLNVKVRDCQNGLKNNKTELYAINKRLTSNRMIQVY